MALVHSGSNEEIVDLRLCHRTYSCYFAGGHHVASCPSPARTALLAVTESAAALSYTWVTEADCRDRLDQEYILYRNWNSFACIANCLRAPSAASDGRQSAILPGTTWQPQPLIEPGPTLVSATNQLDSDRAPPRWQPA